MKLVGPVESGPKMKLTRPKCWMRSQNEVAITPFATSCLKKQDTVYVAKHHAVLVVHVNIHTAPDIYTVPECIVRFIKHTFVAEHLYSSVQ